MVPESEVDGFFAEIDEILSKYDDERPCKKFSAAPAASFDVGDPASLIIDYQNGHETASLKRCLSPAGDSTTACPTKAKRSKKNTVPSQADVVQDSAPAAEHIEYLTEYRDASNENLTYAGQVSPKCDPNCPIGPQLPQSGQSNETEKPFIGPELPKDPDAYLMPSLSSEDIHRHSRIIRDALKTLTSKVSALGETEPTFLQILLIQLMTRITDWECGALSLTYMESCVRRTEAQMLEYERAIAPEGWRCHWNKEHGAYEYENCNDASRQWDSPTKAKKTRRKNHQNKEEGELEDSDDAEEDEDEENIREDATKNAKSLIDAEDLLEKLFDEAKTMTTPLSKPVEEDVAVLMEPETVVDENGETPTEGQTTTEQDTGDDDEGNLLVGYSSSESEASDDDEDQVKFTTAVSPPPKPLVDFDLDTTGTTDEDTTSPEEDNHHSTLPTQDVAPTTNLDDALLAWERIKENL